MCGIFGIYSKSSNVSNTELLSGEKVHISNFDHNNMVPYFGSKIPNTPSLNNSSMISL